MAVVKPLHVLLVEDSEHDAELLVHELEAAGYHVSYARVDTADDMKAALKSTTWDVVFSDYSMPAFSGMAALEVLRTSGYDLPFIIVSGTIGEETAVDALKAGANDFLIKTRMARLAPALERELREVSTRRERARLEEQLRQAQKRKRLAIWQAASPTISTTSSQRSRDTAR